METVSVPLVLAVIAVTLFSAMGMSSCATTRGKHTVEIEPTHNGAKSPDASHHPDIAELYQIYQLSINPWLATGSAIAGTSIALFEDPLTDTVAAALWRNGIVLVVFRGTQNGRRGRVDRAHNFRIALEPIRFAPQDHLPGGPHTAGGSPPVHRAHLGFQQKYLGVRDQLNEYLHRAAFERLVFAGHSAGGALATLAYYDYVVVGPMNANPHGADSADHAPSAVSVELVTFGAPRVLDREAAAAVQQAARDTRSVAGNRPPAASVYRVVNGRDVIPRVPSRLFGYRHIGTPVRIGSRPVWKPVSGRDHFPGYRVELEALLIAGGRPADVDPDPSHWEFWSRLNHDGR